MKHNIPKISIITPSYNQGDYIEETITSVLEQNYQNLEYIIIDGGSNDKTIEIIKKYEKHITYWVSETDRGQSHAINKGMQRATGEIVNWLNSDDYLQPGALHHIANIFQEHPNINCYAGVSRVFGCNKEFYSNGTDIYPDNLTKTIAWARIDQPETYFRRSVWQQIGYLNENLHYLMDRDFWIRYLFYYGLNRVYKDKNIIVNFRLHQHSKTIAHNIKFIDEQWILWKSHAYHMQWNSFFEKISLHYQASNILLEYSINNKSNINELDIINYFFLYLKLESYALNQYGLAISYSKNIDKKNLDKDSLKLNKSINLRIKFIPQFLKKARDFLKRTMI